MKLIKLLSLLTVFISASGYASLTKDQIMEHYPYMEELTEIFGQQYSNQIQIVITEKNNINAYASYNDLDQPTITLSQGLMNHSNATPSVIAMFICHEIGHFYGGEPKQFRGNSQLKSWSSAEGQADFYATSICMKKIIKQKKFNDIENKLAIDLVLNNEVDKLCQTEDCKVLAKSSYYVARIYADIKFWKRRLSLIRKDNSQTYQTIRTHPNPQCRLDTMIAGILCQEVRDLSKSEDLFLTCINDINRQPSCWLAPTLYQDIL